ncbi:MAG: sulfite exporter TauE/SafE family protein [Gemmatimonadota bacterium]
MTLLGIGLGALIGLSLGLLGGGGSILTVPIFVYVLGFGAKEAIAMSLAVVGVTSLAGAAGHWRAGNVNVRVAVIFGVVAMAGTYGGARLAVYFSGGAQLVLFALVMLAAAYFMFRPAPLPVVATQQGEPATVKDMPLALIVVEGMAVGVLTGLVGVGGGFLIVPALVVLGKVPMKQAVGTSLLVIAMKSAAGFVGYLGQVELEWSFMAVFTAVAIAGIMAGTSLVRWVPQHALQRAFAIFLVVMGGLILYQNRGIMRPQPDAAAQIQAVTTVATVSRLGSVDTGDKR